MVFLFVGVVALFWVCLTGHNSLVNRKLYPIIFLTLWNLCVLSMIRLVSRQLAEAKREECAEQPGAGDGNTRA